jgi:sterol desaturase/sphingolipid hydroxylase (fatty acid hydroxylase superfamily)
MAGLAILFCVWFGALFVFHQLERRLPIHSNYQTGYPRRGYIADIISTIVNGPGLSSLERIVFAWLVTRLPASIEVMTPWPWIAQFAVFLLVNDFGRYWLHRWYHEFHVLWRVHRVHHTIVHMDALSVFRHHVFEAFVKNGLLFLPFRLLGVDDSVIIAYSAIDVVKGFWHHANLRTYIGPLNYVLNSPELHWWHHAREGRGQNSNFGSILSIWDLLFGTFYWPREWPKEIGVDGMDAFPDSYLGQLTSIRFDDEEARSRYGAAARRPMCTEVPYAPAMQQSARASG